MRHFPTGKLCLRLESTVDPRFADSGRMEIFSLTDEAGIEYHNIGDDFGPFDLSCIHRFCTLVERVMQVLAASHAFFFPIYHRAPLQHNTLARACTRAHTHAKFRFALDPCFPRTCSALWAPFKEITDMYYLAVCRTKVPNYSISKSKCYS